MTTTQRTIRTEDEMRTLSYYSLCRIQDLTRYNPIDAAKSGRVVFVVTLDERGNLLSVDDVQATIARTVHAELFALELAAVRVGGCVQYDDRTGKLLDWASEVGACRSPSKLMHVDYVRAIA